VTSTDIAVPLGAEIDTLHNWVYVAGKVHGIATSLARTSFVPASMKGRPDDIAACILTGRELGFDPMASLRSIDIIDGTPALRAITLRAIVQAKGHEVWVEESTMNKAVVCGIRAGSDHIQRSEWTIERAQKAGLTTKKNWRENPTSMLVARATAEVCRLVAADAILGMPYSSEELRDEEEPKAPEADAPQTQTFRRDPLQAGSASVGTPSQWDVRYFNADELPAALGDGADQ